MSIWNDIAPSAESVPYILGAATFATLLVLWLGLMEDHSADRRLAMLDKRRNDLRLQAMKGEGKRESMTTATAKNVVEGLKLNKGKEGVTIASELAQAGFRGKDAVAIYLFIRLFMPLVGAVLAYFLFWVLRIWETPDESNLWIGAATTVVLATLMPAIMVRNMRQRRMTALLKSLPDGLDLFVICAEAGLSLDATFDRVSREIADAHPILADEFGLTSVELGFMPERSKALAGLADRCPLQGIRSLVSTLTQTERYGTPLAVAMRVLSQEMRNERMMKAEEKAARLPAVMTVPMILFILPPLFVVLIGPAIIKALDAFKP